MSEMTLRMPCNYVEIENEEMQYVEGGIDAVKTSWVWTGKRIDVYLNSTEANELAIGGSALYGLIASWTYAVPIASAILWTMSIAWGAYIGTLNADGSGVILRFNYIGRSIVLLSDYVIDR